jgi:hypothetical protein
VGNELEQLLERPSRPSTPRAGPASPARILEAGVIYHVKEELVYLGIDMAKSYLDAAIGAEKRRQLFIGVHNETLSVIAVYVSNEKSRHL